jgi:hypothetical protein
VLSRRVPGFLPSTSGFHFPNAFPHGPLFRVGLAGVSIPLGDAANGICGGMIFAARDLFESSGPPPPDRTVPGEGTPLFRYLVARLFASFDLPRGPLRYLAWMWMPEGSILRIVAGRRRRTARRQWPRIRADIDGGHLSPVGLVRTRAASPLELGRNHQALAYGYDVDESTGDAALLLYDPNHPDDDSVVLRLNLRESGGSISYLPGEAPVFGFFRSRYRFHRPPPAVQGGEGPV